MTTNATHDPELKSWVESANASGADFPIQNLPHGVFRRRGGTEAFRGGVAIGDEILDMAAAARLGVFSAASAQAAAAAGEATLNGLMAMGSKAWTILRAELSRLLRQGAPEAAPLPQGPGRSALPISTVSGKICH